jgi:hypothetical protein
MGVIREWVAHHHGVDTGLPAQLPHSAKDGRTGRVGGTAPGCDSQAVSEVRRGGDSPFDSGARGVPEHLMLSSGEWARRHEFEAASSGAENRPRRRKTLERGGESPEGALGPRARWRIARGASRPAGWWAVMVSFGRGPSRFGLGPQAVCFLGLVACLFAFIFFSKKEVFSGH